jgi:hypothetical protein
MVKGNKFLRILATAVILAMLIVVIPVTPALAAERITVTPTSGEIGDYVEVSGSGFDSTEYSVYIYFSSDDADVGDRIDDEVDTYELVAEGDLDSTTTIYTDFDVPSRLRDGDDDEDVTSGDYYVYATYDNDDEILAKDDFRVSIIGLSISPTKGPVGTEVDITGSGFASRKDITIKYDTTDITDELEGDTETDSSGEFSSTIAVPESTKGDHTISVTVSGDKAEAEFTVEPAITISPKEGAVDDRVTVSGTGFARMKDVTITFDGDEVGGETTGSSGSFDAQVNVPELGAGEYEIKAEDESNNSAKATFKISTEVSISPTTSANSPGHVGQDVTISGTGFKPDYDITITYASTPVTFHTTSQSDGSFSYTLEVPPSEAGEHTITATDSVSSMSVSFVMESTPPATPPPLQPYMEGKVKSEAYFDWEDATADIDGTSEQSLPVTYDLQVATDENFTNKVINKTGLTTSEYTLTEAEALESTSKETPYYYWRVRAVDAASNASPWTGTGIFTTGFSFSFPGLSGWLLYVLIGVGALVLFFVGLLVGRRGGGGGDYY